MINSFKGPHRFLSNFYNSTQIIDGITYRSNECYYQAMKSESVEDHIRIARMDPHIAKKEGRNLIQRSNWNNVKITFMLKGVMAKFNQNNYLKNLLVATGEKSLIEGNYWHDNYWGNCYCNKCRNIVGKNQLGQILIVMRNIFKEGL